MREIEGHLDRVIKCVEIKQTELGIKIAIRMRSNLNKNTGYQMATLTPAQARQMAHDLRELANEIEQPRLPL